MTFPEPKSFHSAGVCRDGGTYVVLYVDGAGRVHEIELPVITDTTNGKWGAVGYKQPILNSYDPQLHGRVEGRRQLSWEEGKALCDILAPLVNESTDARDMHRAEEMFGLMALRGRLPNEP